MQVQVTFTGTIAEMAEIMAKTAHPDDCGFDYTRKTPEKNENKIERADAEPPKKRGRPAKKSEEVSEEESEGSDQGTNDVDLGFDDMETEPVQIKTVSLETVITAFQKFAQAGHKDAAVAILKKYKVKSVRDLPAAKYDEILKQLKA